MKISTIKILCNSSNIPDAIRIDDYFDAKEIDEIKTEMQFLYSKMGDESKTQAAIEPSAIGIRRKKRGYGVFVDEVYKERGFSSILNITRKLYNAEIREAITELSRENHYWRLWDFTNFDSTLLQYYSNGDYYDYHFDRSIFTAITPLNFGTKLGRSGGNLWFRNGNIEEKYESSHNSLIIFPSVIEHRVEEMKISSELESIFDYRWSIAHLITMR